MAQSEIRLRSGSLLQSDLFRLTGNVAFIPGGYGGIGAAIARELAARGARVAVAGCHSTQALAIARELVSIGHEAIGFGFDVRRAGEIRDAVTQVVDELGGRHVHTLSVRSKLGLRGRGYSAYVASKGGLAALICQHAVELAPHSITVNAVAPTCVRTELVRQYLEDDEFRGALEARIPLGRIAEPSDVVGPVVFFASPAAGFVTGQVLYVDGGITASQ